MLGKTVAFLRNDIWRMRLNKLTGRKNAAIKLLRMFMLTIRGFQTDRCTLRASGLTFLTVLSIVPVLALLFGIAKGFGMEKVLQEKLLAAMQGQEETAQRIIEFAHSQLEKTQGGLVAGIGLLILLYAVLKTLTQIEASFNDIWHIKRPRSIMRKVADYLAVVIIGPMLLIIASSATVIAATHLRDFLLGFSFLEPLAILVLLVLKLLPYATIWLLFTFMYIFVPNTRVKFTSALTAGIIAGTVFVLFQSLYIQAQVGLTRFSPIYGSFAALPLFLVWLQLSWIVVLFGAELAFAHQNAHLYEFESEVVSASPRFKTLIALWITHFLVRRMEAGEGTMSSDEIADALDLPVRLVNESVADLVAANVLIETQNGKSLGYFPARDPELITPAFVISALQSTGVEDIPVPATKEFGKLESCMAEFNKLMKDSSLNVPLKNI